MAEVKGLTGLRPIDASIGRITCPPYDVIKPGSKLENVLSREEQSLYHITLGKDPVASLGRLIENGFLKQDDAPCFYVYEQTYSGVTRTGFLAAVAVSDYKEGQIIRHEKTFDDKVKGRLELRSKTGYTFEPVFLLTQAYIGSILDRIKEQYKPAYEFTSDFAGQSELHGIHNRIYRIEENSELGHNLQELIKEGPLYIADGHHRYHASLLNRQSHCLAYICQADSVAIQAYNRVINGKIEFEKAQHKLRLVQTESFTTPPKHSFAIYTKNGSFLLDAENIPTDAVGKLDCSILEKELYPILGLSHDLIMDHRYFDYYPEADLETMREKVDDGQYDLAVALHPVSIAELIEVANAGILDPTVVMPEKSTFFAPKILSGLFIYKHVCL